MMFLKRMWRKPLIPLMILAELIASVLFVLINERNIQDNLKVIDQLYNNATIECQIIPNSVSITGLDLQPYAIQPLCQREEISTYFCTIFSPGYIVGEKADGNAYLIYGTNDLNTFCEKMYITCNMAEGYSVDNFCYEKGVCLLEEHFAAEKGYQVGDTVLLTGGGERGRYIESAPVQELTVVGTYSNQGSVAESFVVPESCIYEQGEQRLIFSDETRRLWYKYSKFCFTIDSSYNKVYVQLEASLQEQISAMGEYDLFFGAREMEESLRPLENKLELQRWISLPVRMAFIVLSMLLTLLLLMQDRQEILIRRMRGECRFQILIETLTSVSLLLVILAIPAALLVNLFAGVNGAMEHLLLSVFASAISGGVLLTFLCCKSLISLYQTSY